MRGFVGRAVVAVGMTLALSGVWVIALVTRPPRPPRSWTFSAAFPSSAPPSLAVLSYNIWGVPPYVNADRARVSEIIARLGEYDVVALQEVFAADAFAQVRDAPYPYRILGTHGDGLSDKFGNGLALLSRWPVSEAAEYEFSRCAGIDCTARKGALFARLALDDERRVDVWATHLQSGEGLEAELTRATQARELATFVRGRDVGNPTLFLGDFNTEAGGLVHTFLEHVLAARDAWLLRPPAGIGLGAAAGHLPGRTYAGDNSWNAGGRDQRIDYVLLRAGRALDWWLEDVRVAFAEPVGARHLSDHFGVTARIALHSVLARH